MIRKLANIFTGARDSTTTDNDGDADFPFVSPLLTKGSAPFRVSGGGESATDAAAADDVTLDDGVQDFLDDVISGRTEKLRHELAEQTLLKRDQSRPTGLAQSMRATTNSAVSPTTDALAKTMTPGAAASPVTEKEPGPLQERQHSGVPKPPVSSAARSLQDYELVAYLGSGTFAEVTLARHKVTSELFAIKKISKEKVKKEGCVQRTFTERQLLASMKHPFLVQLHQAFQSRTHLYLVLDFAQGGDLYYFNQKTLWVPNARRALKKLRYPYYVAAHRRHHHRIGNDSTAFSPSFAWQSESDGGVSGSVFSPVTNPNQTTDDEETLRQWGLKREEVREAAKELGLLDRRGVPIKEMREVLDAVQQRKLAQQGCYYTTDADEMTDTGAAQRSPRCFAVPSTTVGSSLPLTADSAPGTRAKASHSADGESDASEEEQVQYGGMPLLAASSTGEPLHESRSASAPRLGSATATSGDDGTTTDGGGSATESGSRRAKRHRVMFRHYHNADNGAKVSDDDDDDVARLPPHRTTSVTSSAKKARQSQPPHHGDTSDVPPKSADDGKGHKEEKSPLKLPATRRRSDAEAHASATNMRAEVTAPHEAPVRGTVKQSKRGSQKQLSKSFGGFSKDDRRADAESGRRREASASTRAGAVATPAAAAAESSVTPAKRDKRRAKHTSFANSTFADACTDAASKKERGRRRSSRKGTEEDGDAPLELGDGPHCSYSRTRSESSSKSSLSRKCRSRSSGCRTASAGNSGEVKKSTAPEYVPHCMEDCALPLPHFAPDESRLPIRLVAFYAVEIALVLQYFHESGFIYRDLKPENILMRADGHIMLTDFGVAKHRKGAVIGTSSAGVGAGAAGSPRAGDLPNNKSASFTGSAHADGGGGETAEERATSFTGTTQYMSPEMLQGEPHDSRTDWWSFGCLLFEWCNGRKAFDQENQFALFKSIVEEDVRVKEGDFQLTALELHSRVAQLHFRHEMVLREYLVADHLRNSFTAATAGTNYLRESQQEGGARGQNNDDDDDVNASFAGMRSSTAAPPSKTSSNLHRHRRQNESQSHVSGAEGGTPANAGANLSFAQLCDVVAASAGAVGGGSFASVHRDVLSLAGTPNNVSFAVAPDGKVEATVSCAAALPSVTAANLLPGDRDKFLEFAWRQQEEALDLLRDLIMALLRRDTASRLCGANVLEHPFFRCTYVTSQLYYQQYVQELHPTDANDSFSFVMLPDEHGNLHVEPRDVAFNPGKRPTHPRGGASLASIANVDQFLEYMPVERPDNWRELFIDMNVTAPYVPRLRTHDDLRYFPDAVTATGLNVAVEQERRLRETREQRREMARRMQSYTSDTGGGAAGANASRLTLPGDKDAETETEGNNTCSTVCAADTAQAGPVSSTSHATASQPGTTAVSGGSNGAADKNAASPQQPPKEPSSEQLLREEELQNVRIDANSHGEFEPVVSLVADTTADADMTGGTPAVNAGSFLAHSTNSNHRRGAAAAAAATGGAVAATSPNQAGLDATPETEKKRSAAARGVLAKTVVLPDEFVAAALGANADDLLLERRAAADGSGGHDTDTTTAGDGTAVPDSGGEDGTHSMRLSRRVEYYECEALEEDGPLEMPEPTRTAEDNEPGRRRSLPAEGGLAGSEAGVTQQRRRSLPDPKVLSDLGAAVAASRDGGVQEAENENAAAARTATPTSCGTPVLASQSATTHPPKSSGHASFTGSADAALTAGRAAAAATAAEARRSAVDTTFSSESVTEFSGYNEDSDRGVDSSDGDDAEASDAAEEQAEQQEEDYEEEEEDDFDDGSDSWVDESSNDDDGSSSGSGSGSSSSSSTSTSDDLDSGLRSQLQHAFLTATPQCPTNSVFGESADDVFAPHTIPSGHPERPLFPPSRLFEAPTLTGIAYEVEDYTRRSSTQFGRPSGGSAHRRARASISAAGGDGGGPLPGAHSSSHFNNVTATSSASSAYGSPRFSGGGFSRPQGSNFAAAGGGGSAGGNSPPPPAAPAPAKRSAFGVIDSRKAPTPQGHPTSQQGRPPPSPQINNPSYSSPNTAFLSERQNTGGLYSPFGASPNNGTDASNAQFLGFTYNAQANNFLNTTESTDYFGTSESFNNNSNNNNSNALYQGGGYNNNVSYHDGGAAPASNYSSNNNNANHSGTSNAHHTNSSPVTNSNVNDHFQNFSFAAPPPGLNRYNYRGY